jgi:dTDP-4-dehydrorhamnose 3,5-epimerase
VQIIDGVQLTALKIINLENGDVLHGMKKNDLGFNGFGEAYFSEIKYNKIKAWKRHSSMTLNLVVPSGKVRFVIYDNRTNSKSYGVFQEVVLSKENYFRLTIPPKLYVAFQGISDSTNILLNIANIDLEKQIHNEKTTYVDWSECQAKNKPVIVLEVGGIKRNETFKIGINGINREADFANQHVDSERWKKFNIELKPWRTTGDAIILCGQHHKSHQWRNNLSMNLWFEQQINEVRKYTNRPIVVRPHPRNPIGLNVKRWKDVYRPTDFIIT